MDVLILYVKLAFIFSNVTICHVFYLKQKPKTKQQTTNQPQTKPNQWQKPHSNSARLSFLSYLYDFEKCSISCANQTQYALSD